MNSKVGGPEYGMKRDSSSRVLVGVKDAAPTQQLGTRHAYIFSIELSSLEHPFGFEESIIGGHAETGGYIELSLSQLDAWAGDWKDHLCKAGCEWVIPILEEGKINKNTEATVARVLNNLRCQ